ncbi:MAG: hypothetical protein KC656_23735, partial [Myxococcales bacterium]|nr:hypothetical protein [Myxococcales bacterium]
AFTGSRWVFGSAEGHYPRASFPGPGGLLIVSSTGGVHDGNQGLATTIGSSGEVAIDPVNGDILYPDGDAWIARSTSGTAGVYRDRCATATAPTQSCYPVDGMVVVSMVVGRDRQLYLSDGHAVVRRPLDAPDIGWEPVASGFSALSRLEMDTHDGLPRLWMNDQGLVWAGVIGDTLPLAR